MIAAALDCWAIRRADVCDAMCKEESARKRFLGGGLVALRCSWWCQSDPMVSDTIQ